MQGEQRGHDADPDRVAVSAQRPLRMWRDGTTFARPTAKWHDDFASADRIPLTGAFDGDGKTDVVSFPRGASART
ncbi:hypothetical protein [Actinophytocola glycyrrhizae]|uniref:VCBS repeat-containing protein n=1 Tax=Actinophytocola glycyrrhizae TaxID=2044873 RepID=A0ABV9SBS2_9PSEU